MVELVILDNPTIPSSDNIFRKMIRTVSSHKWKKGVCNTSFEEKVLIERAIKDFKDGKLSSRKRIMNILDE